MGKTFTANTILAAVRGQQRIALAVASSDIASLLLVGGRTAHSRCKVPLNLTETSTCNLPLQSEAAQLLQRADLIIWDEGPMAHRHVYEAVDRSLCDIMKEKDLTLSHVPFGGKVLLLMGDFRQTLPVVKRGTRSQIVDSCLTRSVLWHHFHVVTLSKNFRLVGEAHDFAEYLLTLGDGCLAIADSNYVQIPDPMCLPRTASVNELIGVVYPDLRHYHGDRDYMVQRAILTPLNEDVDHVNSIISSLTGGESKSYLSADSVVDPSHADLYPTEFLNSLTPSGIPPHRLILKVGDIIMLLRNLAPAQGLCNGTRLAIPCLFGLRDDH